MPKFQYTAVNASGSTLHGVVESDDIREAKKELNNLDLQVVDLKEVDLKTKLLKSSLNKYKFEAVNSDGKVVKGTISALDEGKALSRLSSEYKLNVEKIAHINASNKSFENSSGTSTLSRVAKVDDSRVKALRNILIPIIDDLKGLMRHVSNDLTEEISQSTREFLDKYFLHLDKIKYSDNLNNIQSVCLKICHVLESSEVFVENNEKVEEKLRVNLMAKDLVKRFKNYDLPPSKRGGLLVGARVDSIWNLIGVVFQSKSSSQRKLALKDLFGRFRDLLRWDGAKATKVLEGLGEISIWLLGMYGFVFLIGHFLSVKNLKFSIPLVLEVYSTNVLVYIIIGVLLLHLGFEIVKRVGKNRLLKLFVGSMFLVLYMMICINL